MAGDDLRTAMLESLSDAMDLLTECGHREQAKCILEVLKGALLPPEIRQLEADLSIGAPSIGSGEVLDAALAEAVDMISGDIKAMLQLDEDAARAMYQHEAAFVRARGTQALRRLERSLGLQPGQLL